MNMYPLYVDIVPKRKIIQNSSGNKQSRLEEKVNSLLTRTQSLEDENLSLKKEDGRAEGKNALLWRKGTNLDLQLLQMTSSLVSVQEKLDSLSEVVGKMIK